VAEPYSWAPRDRRWPCRLAAVIATALLAPAAALAADVGSVHGVVHDAQHRPIAGATVELRSRTSAQSQRGTSDASGEFAFPAVPVGDYLLSIGRSGFATLALPLTVVSGAAPSTHVQLQPGAPEETVTVSAAAATATADSFTPTTLVDRRDIARTPGADLTNSLAMITDFVPGAYFVHDQLHVRGGHQTSWDIDGVEIPNTNIASNLGPQIDPRTSTTWKRRAAATRPTRVIAPTGCSTSCRAPASSATARASWWRAAGISARPTTS
jgi:hypothetical protein